MTPKSIKRKRLTGLFLLGFLLFNFPIISIFNVPSFVFKIPVLFIYIFSIWAIFIVLIMLLTREDSHRSPNSPGQQG